MDVQSAANGSKLAKEALDALPTARSFATLGTTLPGVTANQRDVGGTQGERGNVLAAHGGTCVRHDGSDRRDRRSAINAGVNSGSAWSNFSLNDAAAQEMVFDTGAISAEASSGGVRVNVIPREGGNRFSGSAFGNFSNRSMRAGQSHPELQARSRSCGRPGFDSLVDESAAIGGPIRRDRLWFFVRAPVPQQRPDRLESVFSINPLAYVYNPDFTRPLNAGGCDMDNQVRVTAQVSPRNKVSGFLRQDQQVQLSDDSWTPPFSTGESGTRLTYPPSYLTSLSWQSTISSKLLFDSAISYNTQPTDNGPQPEAGITIVDRVGTRAVDHTGGSGRPFAGPSGRRSGPAPGRAALSYVTGSHSAKVRDDVARRMGDAASPTRTALTWAFNC